MKIARPHSGKYYESGWRLLPRSLRLLVPLAALVANVATTVAPAPTGAGEVLDRVVAVVDSEIVTFSQYQEALVQLRGQATEEEILDALINEKLIDREAERMGVSVSDDEIDTAIENRREALGVSEEDFELILSREGMDLKLFRQQIAQGLRRAKLVDHMVKREITITDEELATFYAQNADTFQQADEARIAEIALNAPESLPRAARAKVRRKLADIRRRIVAGESFARSEEHTS